MGLEKTDPRQEACTQLYRHFDAAGKLLYVGVSLSALMRLSQHKDFSHWHKDIVRVEISNYPNRKEALEAEREAIRIEVPAHNIQHQIGEERIKKQPPATKSIELLTATVVDFKPIYTTKEVADLLGAGHTHVMRLIEAGELGSVSWDVPWQGTVVKRVRVSGWQLIEYIESLMGTPT